MNLPHAVYHLAGEVGPLDKRRSRAQVKSVLVRVMTGEPASTHALHAGFGQTMEFHPCKSKEKNTDKWSKDSRGGGEPLI